LVSVAEELKAHRHPGRKLFSADTDVVVVNWDAVNGDPVYGSDRTQQFLAHYQPDMRNWLGRGGVLVVESQGASWTAAQEPYDIFTEMFPKSHVRLCSGMQFARGDRGAVHPDHVDAPLAADLTPDDLQLHRGGLWERRPWFPRRMVRGDLRSLKFIEKSQNHLYRGWFVEWSSDWTPVIRPLDPESETAHDDGGDRALLLYRRVKPSGRPSDIDPDIGLVVLTTMFLASSEVRQLLSNLLTFRDHLSNSEVLSAPENGEPQSAKSNPTS
jgi:hypothetical protein